MTPKYSVINLLQTSDKENIFKAVREEKDTQAQRNKDKDDSPF